MKTQFTNPLLVGPEADMSATYLQAVDQRDRHSAGLIIIHLNTDNDEHLKNFL
jgi:hypothetical protein